MALPLDPEASELPPPTRRVLIVEDHVDSARMMALVLQHLGFDTWAVGSGELAHPAARAVRPDFILLDIGLPKLDGYRVAELVRSDSTLAGVVLIATSIYSRGSHPHLDRGARFDHYFVKPIDFDRLLPVLGSTA